MSEKEVRTVSSGRLRFADLFMSIDGLSVRTSLLFMARLVKLRMLLPRVVMPRMLLAVENIFLSA